MLDPLDEGHVELKGKTGPDRRKRSFNPEPEPRFRQEFSRREIKRAVPKNRVAEVEAHPRFHRLLGRFDIDADWCSELMGLVNDVTGITGIHVDS